MGRGGGNDGGVIATKRYMIRTRAPEHKQARTPAAALACQRLTTCALSGAPLVAPKGFAAAPGAAPGPETADGKKPDDGTVIDAEIVDDKKKS